MSLYPRVDTTACKTEHVCTQSVSHHILSQCCLRCGGGWVGGGLSAPRCLCRSALSLSPRFGLLRFASGFRASSRGKREGDRGNLISNMRGPSRDLTQDAVRGGRKVRYQEGAKAARQNPSDSKGGMPRRCWAVNNAAVATERVRLCQWHARPR